MVVWKRYMFTYKTKDKQDDFAFHIVNIPFTPAYGVFLSQLILNARAFLSHTTTHKQADDATRLKPTLQKLRCITLHHDSYFLDVL